MRLLSLVETPVTRKAWRADISLRCIVLRRGRTRPLRAVESANANANDSHSTASAALLRRFGGRMPIHRYVAGLVDDAIEPGTDRRKCLQIEIAFVRKV